MDTVVFGVNITYICKQIDYIAFVSTFLCLLCAKITDKKEELVNARLHLVRTG
jgi:hypothetical protein